MEKQAFTSLGQEKSYIFIVHKAKNFMYIQFSKRVSHTSAMNCTDVKLGGNFSSVFEVLLFLLQLLLQLFPIHPPNLEDPVHN